MTDEDLETLIDWLRERMPGYELERETENGAHALEFSKSPTTGKKREKKAREKKEDLEPGLLTIPTRISDGGEWPSLAEVQRALETASAPSLLTKGRRLALRAPGEEDDMKKLWVEDLQEGPP